MHKKTIIKLEKKLDEIRQTRVFVQFYNWKTDTQLCLLYATSSYSEHIILTMYVRQWYFHAENSYQNEDFVCWRFFSSLA